MNTISHDFDAAIASIVDGNKPVDASTALARLTTAAKAVGRADSKVDKGSIIGLIIASGGDCDAAKRAFHVGYLIGFLNIADTKRRNAVERAEGVLKAKGFGSKAKPGKGTASRSEAEERAYASSRMAFSRLIKAAGIENNETRGRGTKKRKEAAKTTTAPKVTVKPQDVDGGAKNAKWTGERMEAYTRSTAAALLATLKKHAKDFGTASPFPSELNAAIVAFGTAVNAVPVTVR